MHAESQIARRATRRRYSDTLGVFGGIAARVQAREAEVRDFCIGVTNTLCGVPASSTRRYAGEALSLTPPSGIDAKPQIAIAATNIRPASRVMEMLRLIFPDGP